MSKQNEREVVEDTPQYRSVMMAPLSAPPMPRSLVSMRPSVKSEPSRLSQSTPIRATTWSVSDLPSLPAEYFLERTNVYVHCNAQVVANRICDMLKQESIAAQVDSVDQNLLKAETSENCRFAVRLFSDNGMVVVEVQRTAGCSFLFREAVRPLLKAAKGISSPTMKRRFTIPGSIPKESIEQKEQRTVHGIQVAFDMLMSSRTDLHLLALESIDQITRSCDCLSKAANVVLRSECLEKLLAYAEIVFSEGDFSEIDERSNHIMKRRSLSILANCFTALERSELLLVVGDIPQLKSRVFVSSLVSILRECASNPHEACYAAKCLQFLLTEKAVEACLLELCAISVADDASNVGRSCNSLLEQESRRLKALLTNLS